MKMKIAVGCDHRGYPLKRHVLKLLKDTGHTFKDFGCYSKESVDYPDIAEKVAKAVASGHFNRGILICFTGIGMCIAANKIAGIRAALCYDDLCSQRARKHNDVNILCLGESSNHSDVADILNSFLATEFEAGRHQRRVDKINALEND